MMSWPTTHAILNHFPIALVIVGAIVLLVALIRPMRGAWLFALGSFIFAGISIYPAWLTGEQAAKFVRDAWYIAPGAVHRHAETADITLWIILALGLVSLIAWLSIVRTVNAISPANWLRTLVGLLAIVSLGAVAVTGYLGGKIVLESPILMKPVPPIAVPIPATGTSPGQGTLQAPAGTTPAPAQTTTPTTPATTTPATTTPATTTPGTAPTTTTSGTAPGTAPGGAIIPAQPGATQPRPTP